MAARRRATKRTAVRRRAPATRPEATRSKTKASTVQQREGIARDELLARVAALLHADG